MTPKQRELVRASLGKIRPVADVAARLFYARVFDLDPSLRSLLEYDVGRPGRPLMEALATAVDGIDDFERFAPAVRALGRYHAARGIEPEQYDIVGAAFLWTLEEALGASCTVETGSAWAALYTLLTTTMKDAAYGTRRMRMVGT